MMESKCGKNFLEQAAVVISVAIALQKNRIVRMDIS